MPIPICSLRGRPLIIWGERGPDFRERKKRFRLPYEQFFFQFGPCPQMINGRPLKLHQTKIIILIV